MSLVDLTTGRKLKGIIEKISDAELLMVNENFTFDWSLETGNEVYKIRISDKKEVLGLVSFTDIPEELRIHINLIESSPKQRGKSKTIQNIAGCLISFCCKTAFKRGYDGFVSLIPKTELIDYYAKNYGFTFVGRQMAVYNETSYLIILKYFGDEEI